jgi:iron complex transport system ATP-binding protein
MISLKLKDVSVANRLSRLNLEIEAGKSVGLVGPNGSGKSTLLSVAAGLLPGGGTVEWGGRDLDEIDPLERGRKTAWVPQDAMFSFGFSVRAVVGHGRFAHGDDGQGIDKALDRMDLTSLADRPVNELSGGERQRVLLARAMVTDAPLHLWDEPLAPLDPRHALKVLALADELKEAGNTVILSLHDLRVAYYLDQVVVLSQGDLKAVGNPHDVLTPDLLFDVFGVKADFVSSLILKLP